MRRICSQISKRRCTHFLHVCTLQQISLKMTSLLYVCLIYQLISQIEAVPLSTLSSRECATLGFQVCSKTSASGVESTKTCYFHAEPISVQQQFPVTSDRSSLENSTVTRRAQFELSNVESVLSVQTSERCHLTVCDDEDLMGYCLQFPQGKTANRSQFQDILQSDVITGRCACQNESTPVPGQPHKHVTKKEDDHFDRNYFGVILSPYDKYWEQYPNGTKWRVPWTNYSLDEIRTSLETISTKFSLMSTFGMGTVSNTTEWHEGDKIAFVPQLAAELNAKAGYPRIRLSVGIFRKDDVNVEWKPKELYNAMDAAKYANSLYNGTVWGVTVTSQYVTDPVQAEEALDMIKVVKEINEREKLRLKVGIRLDKCHQFIAEKRPEDETNVPAYQQTEKTTYVSLSMFQKRLQDIALSADYVLCMEFPSSSYAQLPLPSILKQMQKSFLRLRNELKKVNPKLRLIIETGVPSQGIGNGFRNTLSDLRQFWLSMAEFAKREHIMFHMFEALDQPWKNIEDSGPRFDINGANGTDAHYGWWRRANNSEPPVYIEKISEIGSQTISPSSLEDPKNNGITPPVIWALAMCFFGFVSVTMVSIGYLWWKLRNAKRQVISRAYVQQFHCGGDDTSTKSDEDGNYAVALRIPYDRRYELSKENFKLDKSAVMGSGQSGIVVRGMIKDLPQPVAFKCTTPSSSVADIKNIMSEIKILSFIGEHDNVVCILGAYTRKIQRGIVYLALEYCPMGNLEHFLREMDASKKVKNQLCKVEYVEVESVRETMNPGYVTTLPGYISSPSQVSSFESEDASTLCQDKSTNVQEVDFASLLRWSYQIASAMEFVSQKKVIHADLATRNVLISSVDHVKIADFGLSRKLYQEFGVLHDKDTPLPWRWMAPESLRNLVFSVESDVYSFAVLAWEIFSLGEVPFHGVSYDMSFTEQLVKGMRLPRATYSTELIHDQMLKCWSISPSDRPSFTNLKQFFQENLKKSVNAHQS